MRLPTILLLVSAGYLAALVEVPSLLLRNLVQLYDVKAIHLLSQFAGIASLCTAFYFGLVRPLERLARSEQEASAARWLAQHENAQQAAEAVEMAGLAAAAGRASAARLLTAVNA